MNTQHIVFSHGQDGEPWGGKIVAMAEVARRHGLQVDSVDYRGIADPALRVEVKQLFLTTANLAPTIRGYLGERALGVLSVDVDGNDYWFLRELLPLRPYVIIVEYNGSFGLRPITVPYDPAFERHAKHPSGWYHGASISAFHGLCTQHGYSLIGTSQDGLNLFFIRADVAPDGTKQLVPSEAYRENQLRNRWSGTSADQQWQVLHDLPFVEV